MFAGGVFPTERLLPYYHTEAYINYKCSASYSGSLLANSYILNQPISVHVHSDTWQYLLSILHDHLLLPLCLAGNAIDSPVLPPSILTVPGFLTQSLTSQLLEINFLLRVRTTHIYNVQRLFHSTHSITKSDFKLSYAIRSNAELHENGINM